MATHSSIHAWEILWTKELGGPQSMGSQRSRHDGVTGHTHTSSEGMPISKSKKYLPQSLQF